LQLVIIVEFESEVMNAINPNLALNGSEQDVCVSSSVKTEDIKQELRQVDDEYNCEMDQVDVLNCDEAEIPVSTSPTFVVTCTTQIMKRQPTIIVTNARQSVQFNNTALARTFVTKSESSCPADKAVHQDDCRPVYILTSNYTSKCLLKCLFSFLVRWSGKLPKNFSVFLKNV